MKFAVLFFLWGYIASAQNALEILKESDKARGAAEDGLSWTLTIDTMEDGETSNREFTVKTKGVDAYVESNAPPRNKGEVFIFNDRNMWFYKPSLKKPVSISSRQKLTGQAANGDIASTNYSRDYDPVIEKTEMVGKEKFFVLMLKAKTNNLTYDKIRYWISEKTKLATKAEFLNLQGKPFKIGELKYENTIKSGGKKIPFVSQLKIVDAKFSQNSSTMVYKNPVSEKVPNSIFNVNNLSR